MNIPVVGVAPPGSTLVVEVVANDYSQTGGDGFFIGANANGQTAPSYLSSPGCSLSEPTTTGNVGFPNMHIVMNVYGDDQSTVFFDSLCVSYYTGAVSIVHPINGCPKASMAISLPEAQPVTFCINRYTGAVSSVSGRPCPPSLITHIVPDNGPLEVCQSIWTGKLRAISGGQECLPNEIWGAIPAEV